MKREGDGATPVGIFSLRSTLYRRDRIVRPLSALVPRPIADNDGWCDAPRDRNYNRPVKHPYPASAERMRRADGLYDLVVVIGHNDRPCVKGRGSAIFMHVAQENYAPTEGCIALRRQDLVRLVARIGPKTRIHL